MRRVLLAVPFVVSLGLLMESSGVAKAQPGHGGLPPGQEKKHGYDDERRGHDKHGDDDDDEGGDRERRLPPGQAKKYWRFRHEDRDRFLSYYREDADRWQGRQRPVFVPGQYLPRTYVIQVVPPNYWQGAPPPPPGYQYGYSNGYVVAYNPATRIIADALDLVKAASGR